MVRNVSQHEQGLNREAEGPEPAVDGGIEESHETNQVRKRLKFLHSQ